MQINPQISGVCVLFDLSPFFTSSAAAVLTVSTSASTSGTLSVLHV